MHVVTFSFGSAGDVTAILQLAWTLRQALSDTAGASAQIQTLVVDIDSFTLAAADQGRHGGAREHPGRTGQRDRPQARTVTFHALQRVKGRIDGFQARITGAVGRAVWRKYWAVCAWEILGGKREVEALKSRLLEQMETTQTLLAASHMFV